MTNTFKVWGFLKFGCGLVAGIFAAGGACAGGLAEVIDDLQPHPCYAGNLTCITILAPLDHTNPEDNRTIPIEFAIHFATGEHRGVLLNFVGGPGQAGVSYIANGMEGFDSTVREHFDIVYFDQRGTGPTHGIECGKASAAYWQFQWKPNQIDQMIDDAARYAADCVSESGRADILPYVGTAQTIEDVELFRAAVGNPELWMYGASYGSYAAQLYAARYPESIAALILDGVVDPASDPAADALKVADATERLFNRMAEACILDALCKTSFATPVLVAYDRLAAKLEKAPIEISFPLSNGVLETRQLTSELLFNAAWQSIYSPFDRTAFLQALASSQYQDYAPMLRMAYRGLLLDADTLAPQPAAESVYGIYDGAYLGIGCRDWFAKPQDARAAARELIEATRSARKHYDRFYRLTLGTAAVCSFWPALADAVEPVMFVGRDYPVLVIASDADGATPIVSAKTLYDRIDRASLLVVRNGPHVGYGRLDPCVDDIVNKWLLDGPALKPAILTCDQPLLDPNFAVAVARFFFPDTASGISGGVLQTMFSGILASAWNAEGELALGCRYGGSMTIRGTTNWDLESHVTDIALSGCQIWPGLELAGSAALRNVPPEMDWMAKLSFGGEHRGELDFFQDLVTTAIKFEGTLDGEPIRLGP